MSEALNSETMMEKWKEFATPNENHNVLDSMTGSWSYSLKCWMSPEDEPVVSEGSGRIDWIMDGRYIKQDINGTFMGQPFHGMGITGYDNLKQQYQSVWIDNMGTGLVQGSGKYDPESDTLTEHGTLSCPLNGEQAFRSVMSIKDRDNFKYEMYIDRGDGNEYRSLEIVYSRTY